MPASPALIAGAAAVEITPSDSQFLFGYPHVARYSTGVHDPLWASALYLSDGPTQAIFIANDIIFVSKASAQRVRQRIAKLTDVPTGHIMVTATHTHSGPITLDYLSNEADPAVSKTDPAYLQFMEDRIVAAAQQAHRTARPAEAGLTCADATGIGTNRRDPKGPADLQVPVLVVRGAADKRPIAAMVVVCMHPTVLHEDSTLISGDFPGLARQYLQSTVLEPDTPVLYHSGPAGNQSPRHVTRANTFAEAQRLGDILGRAIEKVLPAIDYRRDLPLASAQKLLDLPRREFPSVAQAQANLQRSIDRLEQLRRANAPRPDVRTAEVDWFGAEETLTLAQAAADGRLAAAATATMPAEVQLIRLGPWSFVAWPGEMFVEFGLTVKARQRDAFVIAIANGELQGYIVTDQAAAEGGYEASNAFFAPQSGGMLVDAAIELIEGIASAPSTSARG